MRLPVLIAGVLLSPMAAAAPVLSTVDAFYSKLDLEQDNTAGSVDDANVGLRAWVGRAAPFVTLEYQDAELEGRVNGASSQVDFDSLRGGVGYRFVNTDALAAWARAEYLDLSVGSGALGDEGGFAVHGGASFHGGLFGGYGEVGFLSTDNTSGNELRFGATIVPANYGFFFEVRRTALEVDIPNVRDLTFLDFRLGARWNFY